MLPFSKRNPRNEDGGEAIHTGEFEVIRPGAKARTGGQRVVTPSETRPRVFQRDELDDEKTMVMPSKSSKAHHAVMPPSGSIGTAATLPAPNGPKSSGPSKAAELGRPRPPVHYNDERTIVRPQSAPPPPFERPSARPPMFPAPAPSVPPPPVVLSTRPSTPPPRPADGPDSDPRVNLPATVITTRTRVVTGRPTFSWSAALVAMGVFVGLVSAVVARGDTDALIEATASFVDPSHTSSVKSVHSAQPVVGVAMAPGAALPGTVVVGAVQAPAVLPGALAAQAALPAASLQNTGVPAAAGAVAANGGAPVAGASCPTPELSKAEPAPRAPAPAVAHETTVRHVTHAWAPRPAPRVAPAKTAGAPAAVAAAAPAPAAAPAAPKARASSDDVDGALGADALARAQLEASLH